MADEQAGYTGVVYSDYEAGYSGAEGYTGVVRGTIASGYTGAAPVPSAPVGTTGQSEAARIPAIPWPLEAPTDTGESGSGSIELGGLPILDNPPSYEGAVLDEADDVIGIDESHAQPIIDDPPSYEGVVLDESRVDPDIGSRPGYDGVIASEEPSVSSSPTPMRPGFGDVRIVESEAEAAARAQLRQFASHLLEVQLKADLLQPMMTDNPNLVEQHRVLDAHLTRTRKLLEKGGEGSLVDQSFFTPIKVGMNVGGLAADLMYLDRLGAIHGVSNISRAGVNLGLEELWKATRTLEKDPLLVAETNMREAIRSVYQAVPYRDRVARQLQATAYAKAGVMAAQIMDFVVNAPALLATGKQVLMDLAKWLKEGGGGGVGSLRAALPGGGFLLVSGGRTLALTAAQVEALVQAGLLSANALALYNLATGGGSSGALPPGGGGIGEGPFGARPPGSRSRFEQEDILEDVAAETGKVSTGQRALEEAGVTPRQQRAIYENHHLLVQQLRKWFKTKKINIDDYTVRITADEHRLLHNEYRWNDLWIDFMKRNRGASRTEINAFMNDLMRRFGLEGPPVPLPKG